MDGLYSASLLVALASATIGSISSIIAVSRPHARWRRVVLCCVSLALLLGAVSFTVHLHFGHGQAAPEPMAIGRFLRLHPAYGVVTLLALFAFGVGFLTRQSG